MAKVTLAQRTSDEIEQMIAAGELAPGQQLDEVSLAARFNVSRTPIREAIKHLAARDIVVRGPGRGHYVAEMSKEELAQMFETMAELEFLCARLAAQRISWLQRAELVQLEQKCLTAAEQEDRRAFIAYNEQFHALIYQATHNHYVTRITSDFRQKSAAFRAGRLKTKEQLIQAAKAHSRIVDLITKPSTEDSLRELREHIIHSSRRFNDPLSA